MIISTFHHESVGLTDWYSNVGTALRTDGCIFFVCINGYAEVFVNMQRRKFRKGDLLVLTSDIYFSISSLSDGFSARFVSLSEEMIENAYYKIASGVLWDYLHYSPILRLDAGQYELVQGWFKQMEWILANVNDGERKTLINNNVYNLFTAINIELGKHTDEINLKRKDRAWTITCQFWSLIVKHALTERSVRFYANLLNVTPDYLNKVCRKAYDMSPQGLIHTQLLVDLKSYLSDTKLSVRDIAERMKFDDVSYMCRFFKRMTGLTPLEFRHGKTIKPQ